jgi:hypothetical protein
MLAVDVFPLEVTEELISWKEKDERERRWFALPEAAEAVEEPDLAALIRSFGVSGPPATLLDARRGWLMPVGASAAMAAMAAIAYLLTRLF